MAKSQLAGPEFSNFILSRLSSQCLESVRPHLRKVTLETKQFIYQPNKPIQHAYFVEIGMISVVSVMEDGDSIEVGTIGKEGMAGGFVLLGAASVPYQHYVQIAGHGQSIDADTLKIEAARHDEFRDLILRSQAAFQAQSMQTAACNGLHSVHQRCCRWILLSRDRVESDTFALTHEFLGLMLGVRRASVTDVLGPLQDRGWIQSKRGEITILDRKGLESGSCECYRVIARQQRQILESCLDAS